jgi:VIT1/CCC1 family predicted Fe2+/Mn2+ transporter
MTSDHNSLARKLVLDELLDLSLYRELRKFAKGEMAVMLDSLITIETKHFHFWQKFFAMPVSRLDALRRMKLKVIVLFCRVFGDAGISLVLEAIELYGVKKYLQVWELYQDQPLGQAVRGVLEEEFRHEDEIVSENIKRKVRPERVRDIFLGLNDGLVEILGAVSGFFAAFQSASSVLVAALTVAVAGAFSMAAGAFVAVSSEREVEGVEVGKEKFLTGREGEASPTRPLSSAVLVGVSYFLGAMIPILPVFFGAPHVGISVLVAAVVIALVSYLLAFFSGMDAKRRIVTNLFITALAVGVTYLVGTGAKYVTGSLSP